METTPKTNYTKIAYKSQHHLERYKKYVKSQGLTCQECGGYGKVIIDKIDFGDGSWPIVFGIGGGVWLVFGNWKGN